jgi:hypothetical protein
VSRQVRTRAMLARTFQRVRGDRSILALADPSRRLSNWPSIPSSQLRLFAWRNVEDDARHWNGRSTRSLLLQPEAWSATDHGSTAVWLHRHPCIGALQPSVCIESHCSRICPAHPRSLARCFSRARRHLAFCFVLRRPPVSAFRKSLLQRTQKIFRTFRKRHACGTWERGTLASLRARVTRGQFGQIQTGANRCHSTPTKSS